MKYFMNAIRAGRLNVVLVSLRRQMTHFIP